MGTGADEAALLTRAQQGDREAFWELAEPSVDPIYGLARRLVRSDEDAEDVVADAWLQAMKAIGEFRGHSRFTTWLHQIAVSQALMKLRKHTNDLFPPDSAVGPEVRYPPARWTGPSRPWTRCSGGRQSGRWNLQSRSCPSTSRP